MGALGLCSGRMVRGGCSQRCPIPPKGPTANTGPCLTGRQEASRGQGWEPTQGPTGDIMADARGPARAVQSIPAVSGGPQVAKGRLAPEGLEGRGWIEKGIGEEAGASQERVGAEREEWGNPMDGEDATKLCQALEGGLFCLSCRARILKAFRMKDFWVISNQQLLAWAREPGGGRDEGGGPQGALDYRVCLRPGPRPVSQTSGLT